MFLVVTENGTRRSAVFNVQANLPGGTLIVSGVAPITDGPSTFTLAVTGGTGKYAGARGSMKLHGVDAKPSAIVFTYDLL